MPLRSEAAKGLAAIGCGAGRLSCLVGVMACLVAPPVAAEDGPLQVPSGQPIALQETVWGQPGPEGLTMRFLFVAPEIAREGGSVPFEVATEDMHWLCENYALPRVANPGPEVAQIIISLSDRPVPFGQPAPEATQFFEAYGIEGNTCIWEVF
jgi:hypothetical protein